MERTGRENDRFLELLLPVRGRLVGFARSITDSEEDAADLVGDTLLTALESFDTLRDDEAFLAWLFTIAARTGRRRRRRGSLFTRYTPDLRPDLIPIESTPPDAGPDIALLYKAMAQLPALQREAIALYELSGLPIAEIRKIQGGSASAVKMRLMRGRDRLAELLGAENDLPSPEQRHTTITANDAR